MKAASAVQPSADTRLPSRSASVGPIRTKVAPVRATSGSQVKRPATRLPWITSGTATRTWTPWQMEAIGLPSRMELADDRLHAREGPDVFRSAAAGDVDGVVVGRVDGVERARDRDVVTAMLGVGQDPVHAEIVDAGLEAIALGGVGADDVDLVADRLQRLLEHEDLILFAELADQHQDPLRHHQPPELFVHASVIRPKPCIR